MADAETEIDADDEARKVAWEIDRMLEVGCSIEYAASAAMRGVSWHDVADLVAGGAPPDVAVEILR